MVTHRVFTSCTLAMALLSPLAIGQSRSWIRQFGTFSSEFVSVVAPDDSHGAFIAGTTAGNLGGPPVGLSDVWIARYDADGNRSWATQFGTTTFESVADAEADATGGVYLCGDTNGNLAGPSAGNGDAWLARYDSAGNRLWIRQMGSSAYDRALALAPDGLGGFYLSGTTTGNLGGATAGGEDVWLARFDDTGTQLWIRQFGSAGHDQVSAAVTDEVGGVCVFGQTDGSLGAPHAGNLDIWSTRYDSNGNRIWLLQWGGSVYERVSAAAPDGSGGTYALGATNGNLGGPNAGNTDIWLERRDGAGSRLWIRQFGTPFLDESRAIAADDIGGVYVGGSTVGDLGGPLTGWTDAWLAHYDGAGIRTWIRQFGTLQVTYATAAARDGAGGMFVGGFTKGNLAAASAGVEDAWLAHYQDACPVITFCTAKVNSLGCTPVIEVSGTPSADARHRFTISGSNVRNQKVGWLLYGLNGQSTSPFPTAAVCLANPIRRIPAVTSGGSATGSDCSGVYSVDFNAFAGGWLGGNPHPALRIPGTTVDAQWLGRDPGFPPPDNIALTAGVHFTVCP